MLNNSISINLVFQMKENIKNLLFQLKLIAMFNSVIICGVFLFIQSTNVNLFDIFLKLIKTKIIFNII